MVTPFLGDAVPFFSLADMNTRSTGVFWECIEMFWSKETVNEWKQTIFKDNSGTERLQNVICVSPTTHVLHKKGF